MTNFLIFRYFPGYYDPSEEHSLNKFLWDKMQSTFQCCGAEGWEDWSAAKKLKNGEKVPASCCVKPDECNVYSPTASNIYLQGCVEKLELPYRIVFWALPSIMAFMLMAALIVCSGNNWEFIFWEFRRIPSILVDFIDFRRFL